MTNEDKIRDFLAKVPTDLIMSEAGRRNAARRLTAGRAKVLRACRFCGQFFGMRDLRKHLSLSHPGGELGGNKPLRKMPVGRQCNYCDQVYGARAMKVHIRVSHPDKCRPEKRKTAIK